MRGKVHRGNPVGFPALCITCHFFFFFLDRKRTPAGGARRPRVGPGVGPTGAVEGRARQPPWAAPARRLGREGSAFAGRVGVRPRGVRPVGGAGVPPGIIKSTPDDHLTSSSGSPRPRGSERARPEILQGDVRDGRSQLLRATSEFRLGVGSDRRRHSGTTISRRAPGLTLPGFGDLFQLCPRSRQRA
jgi:hypothetical protein